MKKVLFICLGNACRSQMAEAFARVYGKDVIEPYSAGMKPAGFVHPKVITVMKEVGIDLSGQASKLVDRTLLSQMDWVVTLAQEAQILCPPISPSVHAVHWPIDDPTAVFGKEDRILAAFRLTRDAIGLKVKEFISAVKQEK